MSRLIDADALIDWIDPGHLRHPSELCFSELDVVNMINYAPTIEPERKKGKWIEQDDSWDGVYYECSACGEPWTLIDGTPWDNGMNFCPNCGADMRGEE